MGTDLKKKMRFQYLKKKIWNANEKELASKINEHEKENKKSDKWSMVK